MIAALRLASRRSSTVVGGRLLLVALPHGVSSTVLHSSRPPVAAASHAEVAAGAEPPRSAHGSEPSGGTGALICKVICRIMITASAG